VRPVIYEDGHSRGHDRHLLLFLAPPLPTEPIRGSVHHRKARSWLKHPTNTSSSRRRPWPHAYEVTADQADYFLVKAQVHATLATVDAAVWDAAKREADAASAEAGESE
jgi:hypothetical protein